YGSRVGLEYQRQFPQALRRLVLDGVVAPSLGLPNQDAQVALDAVFADCAKQAACGASYPDLPRRWKELLNSLPRPIRLTHPRLGTPLQ
ncbi:alpha/beta hydrolase, partial [Glaciimonas sp. Cout2]|nr:alpha/beta hydrolase [Glaciimonas sp. Cout2]